jgi:hypothetical protein
LKANEVSAIRCGQAPVQTPNSCATPIDEGDSLRLAVRPSGRAVARSMCRSLIRKDEHRARLPIIALVGQFFISALSKRNFF